MSLGKLLGLIALLLSLYILWQIHQVLLLVFASIVLATALNRLVRVLQGWQVQRLWAVILSMAVLVCLGIVVVWLMVPPFVDQIQQLTQLFPQVIRQIERGIDASQQRLPAWMAQNLPSINSLLEQLQPLGNLLLSQSVNVFSNSLAALFKVLLVLVLTLMLLIDPQPYRRTFVQIFPAFYRRRADQILNQCEIALGAWLTGILFNMSVITLLSWVGLLLLQVQLSLAHGVLAGLLTFIPNIGPGLSVLPPMAIALIDAPWKALAVLILYIAIQQVESNLLTPYVMAQQVALLPAVTLLSQVIFASFFGFLGLLLALPLTVVTQVWLQEVLVTDILDAWQWRQHASGKPAADAPQAHAQQLPPSSSGAQPAGREPPAPEPSNYL